MRAIDALYTWKSPTRTPSDEAAPKAGVVINLLFSPSVPLHSSPALIPSFIMTMNALPLVRLPEPWKTTYELDVVSTEHSLRKFQLRRSPRADDGVPPPKPL